MDKLVILGARYVSGAENLVRGTLNVFILRGVRGSGVRALLWVELGPWTWPRFRSRSGPDPFSDQCSYMYSERLLWVAVFEFRISSLGDIVLGTLWYFSWITATSSTQKSSFLVYVLGGLQLFPSIKKSHTNRPPKVESDPMPLELKTAVRKNAKVVLTIHIVAWLVIYNTIGWRHEWLWRVTLAAPQVDM